MTFPRLRLDLAVACLVLVPYVGLLVPFQAGLLAQAGLICLLLVLVAASGDLHPAELVPALSGRIAWGLGLYGAAALWGAAVGLLSGNPVRYVASQTVALLLLPVAFVAFARSARLRGRTVVTGVAIASVIALAIHTIAIVVPGLGGRHDGGVRFVLRNDVGVTGAIVLIFLVLLASATSRERDRGPLEIVGLGAATVLLLGSLSRGAWLAAGLGVAVLLWLHAGGRRRGTLWISGAGLALGAVLMAAAGPVLDSGPILFERGFEQATAGDSHFLVDPSSARTGKTSLRLSPGPDTWRRPLAWNVPLDHRLVVVHAWAKGETGRRLASSVTFHDQSLKEVGRQLRVVEGTGEWSAFRWLVLVPEGARTLRLWASAGEGQGSWLVDDITIRGMKSAPAAGLAQLAWRASSMLRYLGSPAIDGGVSYRVLELRAILSEWRRASLGRLLVGQGLGATFAFENLTWTPDGRQVRVPEASYIHNFYLFLAFKLGLAGIAALAGLLSITLWVIGLVRQNGGRGGSTWIAVGAGAAWLAYLAWSVTSPEIYNFRVAPLWGAVLAATWTQIRSESRRDQES